MRRQHSDIQIRRRKFRSKKHLSMDSSLQNIKAQVMNSTIQNWRQGKNDAEKLRHSHTIEDYRDKGLSIDGSPAKSKEGRNVFSEIIREDKIYGDLLSNIRTEYQEYIYHLSQNESAGMSTQQQIKDIKQKIIAKQSKRGALEHKLRHLQQENTNLKWKLQETGDKAQIWHSELVNFSKNRDLGIELNQETWDKLLYENKALKDLIEEIRVKIEKSKQNRVDAVLKQAKLNSSCDKIRTPKITQRPTIRRHERPSFIPELNLKNNYNKMQKCAVCHQNTAEVICSWTDVPLWYEHLPIHLKEQTGPHIAFTIDIYHNMQKEIGSFIDTNQETFALCQNFLKTERMYLDKLEKYKWDLRSKVNELKDSICMQLDNMLEYKFAHILNLQDTILENIDQFNSKRELARRTDSLQFDLESSVDEIIDTFVTSIGHAYDIQYRSISPDSPLQNSIARMNPCDHWNWSETLKGSKVVVSENGKTINTTEDTHSVVMVDVPLTEGKYAWKIQLDKCQSRNSYLIGVAEKNLDLNSLVQTKSFWGLHLNGYRYIKGCRANERGIVGNEGDIIEVELEFVNSKGVLRFTINGENLGVLASNIDPPIYPTVQIYYKEGHQMSLIG